jgi:hypothetical protein
MRVCRFETTVSGDGTVTVKDIPFPPGQEVEVVVCSHEPRHRETELYPLRGKPMQYIDPFESVAEDDWEIPR